MTEEEAKTKWCPMVRSTVVGADKDGKLVVISNRDDAQMVAVNDPNVMTHNCIGSACMAWRWTSSLGAVAVSAECVALWEERHYEKTGKIHSDGTFEMREKSEHREGCCGLAGTP